jgi:acetoin utilization protein AcuC
MPIVMPYDERLASYDLGPQHPLQPERFTLAIDLMEAYGLFEDSERPDRTGPLMHRIALDDIERADIELIHDPSYVDAVVGASRDPHRFRSSHGIGPGDTPPFHGMHEASMLVCASTTTALRRVIEGDARRGFAIAGGLHHAHHDRAAGFCVYNDPAVAMAVMLRDHPGATFVYIDIDAHHGDGVQEAFYASDEVLTISVHESGTYLFPGTGRHLETGEGDGAGYSINVPLPPLADDECYSMVFRDIIAPAVQAFAPTAIVAQCGADAHIEDPLTHLAMTLEGHRTLVDSVIELADEVCAGRIVCTGGGGYGTYSVVPRAWANVGAALLGRQLRQALPESWREHARDLSGENMPLELHEEEEVVLPAIEFDVRSETASLVERVRSASPLLSG